MEVEDAPHEHRAGTSASTPELANQAESAEDKKLGEGQTLSTQELKRWRTQHNIDSNLKDGFFPRFHFADKTPQYCGYGSKCPDKAIPIDSGSPVWLTYTPNYQTKQMDHHVHHRDCFLSHVIMDRITNHHIELPKEAGERPMFWNNLCRSLAFRNNDSLFVDTAALVPGRPKTAPELDEPELPHNLPDIPVGGQAIACAEAYLDNVKAIVEPLHPVFAGFPEHVQKDKSLRIGILSLLLDCVIPCLDRIRRGNELWSYSLARCCIAMLLFTGKHCKALHRDPAEQTLATLAKWWEAHLFERYLLRAVEEAAGLHKELCMSREFLPNLHHERKVGIKEYVAILDGLTEVFKQGQGVSEDRALINSSLGAYLALLTSFERERLVGRDPPRAGNVRKGNARGSTARNPPTAAKTSKRTPAPKSSVAPATKPAKRAATKRAATKGKATASRKPRKNDATSDEEEDDDQIVEDSGDDELGDELKKTASAATQPAQFARRPPGRAAAREASSRIQEQTLAVGSTSLIATSTAARAATPAAPAVAVSSPSQVSFSAYGLGYNPAAQDGHNSLTSEGTAARPFAPSADAPVPKPDLYMRIEAGHRFHDAEVDAEQPRWGLEAIPDLMTDFSMPDEDLSSAANSHYAHASSGKRPLELDADHSSISKKRRQVTTPHGCDESPERDADMSGETLVNGEQSKRQLLAATNIAPVSPRRESIRSAGVQGPANARSGPQIITSSANTVKRVGSRPASNPKSHRTDRSTADSSRAAATTSHASSEIPPLEPSDTPYPGLLKLLKDTNLRSSVPKKERVNIGLDTSTLCELESDAGSKTFKNIKRIVDTSQPTECLEYFVSDGVFTDAFIHILTAGARGAGSIKIITTTTFAKWLQDTEGRTELPTHSDPFPQFERKYGRSLSAAINSFDSRYFSTDAVFKWGSSADEAMRSYHGKDGRKDELVAVQGMIEQMGGGRFVRSKPRGEKENTRVIFLCVDQEHGYNPEDYIMIDELYDSIFTGKRLSQLDRKA